MRTHSQYATALLISLFFFFNDTATTEIYTLSLHDALPIWADGWRRRGSHEPPAAGAPHDRGHRQAQGRVRDRKSTRLNSSHGYISYAVFCLKKKKKTNRQVQQRTKKQTQQLE